MKKLFILTFVVSLFFTSQSNAQWWVDGGNLIWPYGDVTIKQDLNVNGTIANDGVRPYKVYTALLNQEQEFAPTAIVLENTIGNVTFSRNESGIFVVHGVFPFGKTALFVTENLIDGMAYGDPYEIKTQVGSNAISLIVMMNGMFSDDALENSLIEIRVYP